MIQESRDDIRYVGIASGIRALCKIRISDSLASFLLGDGNRASRIVGVFVMASLLSACAESPVTGRQQLILMSEVEAAAMGQQAYRQILAEKGVARDRSAQQRIDRIGRRIQKAVDSRIQWEFTVIADDTPNAFALPGGKVGVNTGMFRVAKTDAQLAAVIGHEIAHVTARHPSERLSRQMLADAGLGIVGAATNSPVTAQLLAQAATLGVHLPFSRSQEAEADEIGVQYMARAGYDPRAAIEVWQAFAKMGGQRPPQFLSTHPSPDDRIKRLQKLMPKALSIYRKYRP